MPTRRGGSPLLAVSEGRLPLVVSQAPLDMGIRGEDIERDTRRVVAGIEGDLEATTHYEVAAVRLDRRGQPADQQPGSTTALPRLPMRSWTPPPARSSAVPWSSPRRCGSMPGSSSVFYALSGRPGLAGHTSTQQRLRAGEHPRHNAGSPEASRPDHDQRSRLSKVGNPWTAYLTGDSSELFELPAGPVGWAAASSTRGEEQEHPGARGRGRAHAQ